MQGQATRHLPGVRVISARLFDEKSSGYIIDSFDTLKLKGYRISDEKVAAFKFCKKGDSYASSKTVFAQNGVITVQCYYEQSFFYGCNTVFNNWTWAEPIRYGDCTEPMDMFCSTNLKGRSDTGSVKCNYTSQVDSVLYSKKLSCDTPETPSDHFDMGSSFGSSKDSAIKGVSFTRGYSAGEMNIYYASRQSLKSMGVEITNEQKVVLPQGKSKYCQPPVDWKG